MRGKQAVVVYMAVLSLTACTFSPADAVEPSREMSKAEAEKKQTAEQGGEQGTEQAAVQDTEQKDAQLLALYEIFINQEYAGAEGYAYVICDGDGDGSAELYIERAGSQGFYVNTYKNGGLCIRYQEELPPEFNGQLWTDTETLAGTQSGEMAHSGIYVFAKNEDMGERYWYPSETDFVRENGFGEVDPFYEYYIPDGQKRLTLYYDEATQKGCGIRYYEWDPSTFTTTGMYGFVFEGLKDGGESGIREDYLKPESVDGVDGSNEVEDFTENIEYDDQGRITHYDAAGLLTFLADDNTEPGMVLRIDYEYYDNGNLKSRFYGHNGYIFGTWYSNWDCYFDGQGRIAYEDIYITHGSWDIYYIYKDDTEEPAYILDLDNNLGEWIPTFRSGR